jgi:probable rRNA maturation factor
VTEVVVHALPEWQVLAEPTAALLRRAAARLELPPGSEVALVLTDDEELRRLNRTFRNSDEPTDVLSFAPRAGYVPEAESGYLGDIVISVPFAERSAAAAGRAAADEVALLAVHGLLHLVGYEHETEEGERAMRWLEAQLGVRPPG